MVHFFPLEVKPPSHSAKRQDRIGKWCRGNNCVLCFSHFFLISSSVAIYGPLSSANPSQKAIKHTDSYSTHFSRDNVPLNGHCTVFWAFIFRNRYPNYVGRFGRLTHYIYSVQHIKFSYHMDCYTVLGLLSQAYMLRG
jgi:hypothetical protein